MRVQTMMIGAVAIALTPAAASAAPSKTTPAQSGPSATTGQPSQDCQMLIDSGMGSTPGNSVNSPGSAFNPAGKSGTMYAGQQQQNTVNSATSSQYDVACLHGTR
jgi:hypothetical protein